MHTHVDHVNIALAAVLVCNQCKRKLQQQQNNRQLCFRQTLRQSFYWLYAIAAQFSLGEFGFYKFDSYTELKFNQNSDPKSEPEFGIKYSFTKFGQNLTTFGLNLVKFGLLAKFWTNIDQILDEFDQILVKKWIYLHSNSVKFIIWVKNQILLHFIWIDLVL